MKQPTEPLSLARIHDVYSGTSVKRETSDKKLSYQTTQRFAREAKIDAVVLSGGVFQNELLLEDLRALLAAEPLTIWTNHAVPANDGGISLGQAALVAFMDQEQQHA